MNYIDGNAYFKGEIKNIYPYLSYDIDTDICILGGGLSGLITAYYLAKKKNRVVILEKNIIGFGTSGCDMGIIDVDITKLHKQKTEEEIRKIGTLYNTAKKELYNIAKEIGYEDISMVDKVIYSNKFMQKGSVQKEASVQASYGNECEVVESLQDINSSINILFEDKVPCIDPFEFIQKLAEYLTKELDVKIYENTEVVDIEPAYDNVLCTTSNNFEVNSQKLIFCTGNDFLKYVESIDVQLFKRYVVVTKIVNEFAGKGKVLYNFNDEDSSIRILNNGQVMVQGESIKLNVKLSDENYKKLIEKEKFTKLIVFANKLLNVDKYIIDIDSTYSYVYGKNFDSLPYIDELECMANCFANTSFGENTLLSSIIGGQMLTDAVNGLFKKEMRFFRINRANCN